MEKTLVECALAYADLGWHVIPLHWIIEGDPMRCSCGTENCRTPGKHPLSRHGVGDATTDQQKIKKWWKNRPANIGIATGQISGFIAVDIDPRNGGDTTFEKFFNLPFSDIETAADVIANTGGGGYHLLYRDTDQNIIKPGEGIDIKTDGGYIIVEPSTHISGNDYEWQIDADPLRNKTPGPVPPFFFQPRQPPLATLSATCLDSKQIIDLQMALTHISADDYRQWIYVGMALHSAESGEQGFVIWDAWSQTSAKYTPGEMRAKWASFSQKNGQGINVETIFYWAKENGYKGLPPESSALVQLPKIEENPPIEFPAKLLNVPGLLGAMTEWINNTAIRRQPVFSLANAICILGTIMGRRYRTETDLRSNFYLMALGETGCGKEHSRKAFQKIIECFPQLKNLKGGSAIASGSAMMKRIIASPSVLFQIDEAGQRIYQWAKPNASEHKAEIIPVLMELFSSANSVYGGVERAMDQKRTDIIQPNVSIYATTTSADFYKAFTNSAIEDGFLNRWIVVRSEEDRPPREKPPLLPVPQEVVAGIQVLIGDSKTSLVDAGADVTPPVLQTVPMTPPAENIFFEYEEYITQEIGKHRENKRDKLWARAWEHAAKLANLHGCSRNPRSPKIEKVDAEWGVAFARYSVELMTDIVGKYIGENEHDQKLKRMLSIIGNPHKYKKDRRSGKFAAQGYIARGHLSRLMHGSSKRDLDVLVESAIEAELISTITIQKQMLYFLTPETP